jgi:hypothetical protein
MGTNISKNARTNVARQIFYCPCGGEVRMISVFRSGKIRHVAKCMSCEAEKRKPSDFR